MEIGLNSVHMNVITNGNLYIHRFTFIPKYVIILRYKSKGGNMPLKKSASKKENNERRLDNIHARNAAEKKYGKSAIKGKQVHHKDGNQKNNSASNLELTTAKKHGAMHGRGNGKRGTGKIKSPKKK
jgi:hypothetical protein